MGKLRSVVVRSRSVDAAMREAEVMSHVGTMREGDSFTFDADPREDVHLAQTLMKAEAELQKRGMTLVTEQGGPRMGRLWWALPRNHPDAVRVPYKPPRDREPDWSKMVRIA